MSIFLKLYCVFDAIVKKIILLKFSQMFRATVNMYYPCYKLSHVNLDNSLVSLKHDFVDPLEFSR